MHVDLNPNYDIGEHFHRSSTAQVWVRSVWTNDWMPMPYLWPEELAWAVAPGISQASFSWRYGRIIQHDAAAAAEFARVEVSRWYVKVKISDWLDPASHWYWYGVIEDPVDQLGGVETVGTGEEQITRRHGRQALTAFGMELLLDRHVILTSTVLDHETQAEHVAPRGITFNHDNRANRTPIRNGSIARHRFYGGDDAESWSTRDIAEYLLVDQTPRAPDDSEVLRWRMLTADRDLLPAWDQPVIPTHGRSPREVLNDIIDRRRMLSYYIEVYEDPEDEEAEAEIRVRPFTFLDAELTIDEDEGMVLAANPQLRTLDFDRNQSAAGATLTAATLHQADQVIVQGARRRDCFSLSWQDDTLDKAWDETLEEEYITAASGAEDYPTTKEERLRRNREARGADKFDTVYARYQLPADWDFMVGDGIGGTKVAAAPHGNDLNDPHPFYRPELYLLPTIPLLEGHLYDQAKIASENVSIFAPAAEYRELAPLIVAELPEAPGRWVQLDRWGEIADLMYPEEDGVDRQWSADVQVPHASLRLEINVQGGPRHALGAGHFTAVDSSDVPEEEAAIIDWRDIIATVAVADDRHCEARYPLDDDLSPVLEAVRRLRIDVGDDFRLDYVASTTVVGVDPSTGALLRTIGGGFIRDDRPALQRLARLAYEWFSKNRAVLAFGVVHPVARESLWLGDYVQTIGGDETEVNSVITEIRFRFGVSEGNGEPPPNRQDFTTGFGELDVTRFV